MDLRWLSMRKVVLGVVCLATLVLAVSAGALADSSPGEPDEGLYILDPTAPAPTVLVKGEEDEVAWSPDGRWITALDTNDYYFNVVDSSGGNRHRVDSFSWSNDGSRIAYKAERAGSEGPVFVSSATWRKPRLVTRATHSSPLGWAPDGRHFVYGTGGDACCYRALVVVTGNGSRPRTVLKTGGPYKIAWSPNGKLIAAVGYDQYVYLASSVGGPARRLPGKWGGFPDPQWYPGGKSFVVYPAEGISSTGGFDAVRISVPTGARKVVCKDCQSFELSPDHRSIAYVDSNWALWVENADGSAKRLIADTAGLPRWSGDGSALLLVLPGSGDYGTTLAIADLATGKLTRLTDGTNSDEPIGISADGRFVAFRRFSETTGHELWLVGSDGTHLRKVMSFGTCSQAAWSPKTALLAITNLDDC